MMDGKHNILREQPIWYRQSTKIGILCILLLCMNSSLVKKGHILPKESFVVLLVDLALVEAMVDTFYYSNNIDEKKRICSYNNSLVYERHATDPVSFQKTYIYYLQHHPQKLIMLYNEVRQRLEKLLYKNDQFEEKSS